MCNLRHYLGITLAVSILAVSVIDQAIAKPPARSKALVTSQLPTKVVAVDDRISPPPINAILANLKFKSAPAKSVSTARLKTENSKSAVRLGTPSRNLNPGQNAKTTSLVKVDQSKRQSTNFVGINQWID